MYIQNTGVFSHETFLEEYVKCGLSSDLMSGVFQGAAVIDGMNCRLKILINSDCKINIFVIPQMDCWTFGVDHNLCCTDFSWFL